MAIIMAVLLKYFVIEAYKIPTGSMQPTLMGNDETGIHDAYIAWMTQNGQHDALVGAYRRFVREKPDAPVLRWFEGRANYARADRLRSEGNFQGAISVYRKTRDIFGEYAVNRVVLEQVCQGLRVGEIVDCDDLELGAVLCRAEHISTDTTKTVDGYFYRHFCILPK